MDYTNCKVFPASPEQEGVWFHALKSGTSYWNFVQKKCFEGSLDIPAFQKAFQIVLARHESLRTNFRLEADTLNQVIQDTIPHNDLFIHKMVSGVSADNVVPDENTWLKEAGILQGDRWSFDLENDALLRLIVLQSGNTFMAILVMSHIITDHYSMKLFWNEMACFYNAILAGNEPPAVGRGKQYVQFTLEQQVFANTPAYQEQKKYWLNKLFTEAPPLNFSFYVSGNSPSLYSKEVPIPVQLFHDIRTFSLKQRVLLSSVFQLAYFILLYKLTGNAKIVVGNVINGRGFKKKQYNDVIGLFAKRIINCQSLNEEDSLSLLLSRVNADLLTSFENSNVSYEELLRHLNQMTKRGLTPLFQALFNMIKSGGTGTAFEGLEERTDVRFDNDLAGDIQSEIGLTITDDAAHPALRLDLKCDELFRPVADSLVEIYLNILHECVHNSAATIADIDIITGGAHHLLKAFNNTAVSYPIDRTVIDLFREQCTRTPQQNAVVFGQEKLSYRELDIRSDQLGHYLRKRGVKEDTLVPICIDRSVEMLVGILAIMKAGAAYVPVDPGYPAERIGFMLEDTSATLLLTSTSARNAVPDSFTGELILLDNDWPAISVEPASPPQTKLNAGNLAYVIYTSGSTGMPKGVMIEHRSLMNYLCNGREQYTGKDAVSGSYVYLPFTFDASLTSLFVPLIGGRTIVVSSTQSTEVFEDSLFKEKAPYDFIKLTPAHLYLLEPLAMNSDRTAFFTQKLVLGGEALQPGMFQFLKDRGIGVKIINEYGPTETTVGCSTYSFTSTDGLPQIPIGKPLNNVYIHILDGKGRIAPIGIAGEICVGGIQVARGYLNRPELTSEKFIQDPFSNEAGARLYRTGDSGRWLPDGNIEYLGRMDDQMKIRGYRIEPGEIERTVLESGQVNQCVVVAGRDTTGNSSLVGYVTAEPGFERELLIKYLQRRLPDYMVPRLWVLLAYFPLTNNGKVDKHALPDVDAGALQNTTYAAPCNELETSLAAIWQELLGVKQVGRDDNFFSLGGHSLLATRMVSAVRKIAGADLSIRDVFNYPTIAQLSDNVSRMGKTSNLPPLQAQVRPAHIPLSFSQERLWVIDRLEGSVHYHIPWVLRVKGRLNHTALESAFKNIVNRHEVLRTVFRDNDGVTYQQVMDTGGWVMEKIAGQPYTKDPAGLAIMVGSLVDAPFDLSQDHMLRVQLIEHIADSEHILVINLHHIASDGWSMGILVRELTALYAGHALGIKPVLPALPVQYADYSIWQRRYLQGAVLEEKLSYWRRKLSGVTPLSLPLDHVRPPEQSTRGESIRAGIGEGLINGLRELSHANEATLFMTMLTAFKVLLYRYNGQKDICVGTPIAGRTQQETEGLIGFFINMLALRTDFSGDFSFKALLQLVKQTTLEAFEHQDVPFAKVVEEIVRERDLSRSPLFQVLFVMQNTPETMTLQLGNEISLSNEEGSLTRTKFDLTVTVFESEGGMGLSIEYCTDLFDRPTIERMMRHYMELLKAVVNTPDQAIKELKMLTAAEETQILTDFNQPVIPRQGSRTLVDLFSEQCSRNQKQIAVVFGDRRLTYHELDEKSNQLGHYLRSRGIKEESLVPICIDRSIEMIVGILGIMKAGAAYVPIDPEYPGERIGYMLADTSATLVLSSDASRSAVPNSFQGELISLDGDWRTISTGSPHLPQTALTDENLAYVIYTSGSTGKPKGVMIAHRNVMALLSGFEQISTPDTTVFEQPGAGLMVCSYAFDVSVWEIFINLCFGRELHILSKERAVDEEYIARYVIGHRITTAYLPPTFLSGIAGYFEQHTRHSPLPIPLSRLLVGVMPIREEVLQRFRDLLPAASIINGYGPTETTICATFFPFRRAFHPAGNTPIGKPVKNYRIYILHNRTTLVPVGVQGEICIAGDGVGRGYLNNAQLTAAAFIPDPFLPQYPPLKTGNQSLLYCTGDLGRWTADGNIEYTGRKDDQAKVNGYRIEPGEIEAIIQQSGLAVSSVVLIDAGKDGSNRLVGFVIPSGLFDPEQLIWHLQGYLPEYMIPRWWIPLDAIPLTLNGKVDRALLLSKIPFNGLNAAYTAPRNDTEKELINLFSELLKADSIGIKDNFFSLGGNSLLAIQLLSRIRKKFKLNIPVKVIFKFPHLDQMAEYIDLFIEKEMTEEELEAYEVFEL